MGSRRARGNGQLEVGLVLANLMELDRPGVAKVHDVATKLPARTAGGARHGGAVA